jgi:Tol biopolymer transport system component
VSVIENLRRAVDATSGAAQFAGAESGTFAYITGSATDLRLSTLALAPIDGKGEVQSLSAALGRYSGPRVSPDGRQFSVTLFDDSGLSMIWIGGLSPPSPLRRLTAGPRDRASVWTSDSKSVLFMADTPALGVYRQLADGSAPAVPVITGPEIASVEAAHPDGKTIAFTRGPGLDIWIDDGESKPRPLVVRAGAQRYVTFSPDGRLFAYTSREASGSDIIVEPFPPNGAMHHLSTGGGSGPRWSPTGTDIYYQSNTTDAAFANGKLMRIAVRTTPTFSPVAAPVEVLVNPVVTALFANFDITPDGKNALVILPRSGKSSSRPSAQQIHVVVNWLEELKAKVATR